MWVARMSMSVTRLVLGLLVLSYIMVSSDACSCLYEYPQNTYCKADYVIKVRIIGSHMVYKETDNHQESTVAPQITESITREPIKEYKIIDTASLTEDSEENVNSQPKEPVELRASSEEEPIEVIPPIYQSYKVNINKIFKGEEQIAKLVDSHHILTNAYGSLCGKTRLSNGTRYLMIGKIVRGNMWVSLCDYVQEWKTLTVRMRKNIHYNYDRNCDCKVENCRTKNCHKQRENATCFWETTAKHEGCYIDHAYCQLRTENSCKWSRNSATVECIQNSAKNRVDTQYLP